ncbi:MAG TPA: HPP family protein [Gammaproteobacteria bacterium]|nr:HPP family protein [Gammaproteobacteria bacterium]
MADESERAELAELPGVKGWLGRRLGGPGLAFYAFFGCLAALAILGEIAEVMRWPLLFASLGPTVMLFFERSSRKAAQPRNTLIGHAVGIICGWIALVLFGLNNAPSVMHVGVTPERLAAAALSVALTAFFKHLLKAPHPPAGSTALLVSLGFFTTWFQLGALMFGIVLLTIIGWLINRLLGVRGPLWGKPSSQS